MIDEHELVRRAVEGLSPPEPAFDRLLDRRDRRHRNERVAAALAGLAIFAAGVWAVASSEPLPTSPPGGPSPTVRVPEPVPEATYPGPVGLVGLPPVDATPSSPAKGELVASFLFGHGEGDAGRFGLHLYADGRLIWHRLGDGRTRGLEATGLIEQRLTSEGVELVRSEMLSTGLFDHDLHLTSGEGLFFGEVEVRDGDRRVLVTWGDVGLDGVERVVPTPEQAAALKRLDARLLNLAAWLPASAWEDRELRPFVPSRFAICYDIEWDVGLDRVLASFPRRAEELLRSWERTYEAIRGGADSPSGFDVWCSRATPGQAHELAGILDDAGSERFHEDPDLGYIFEAQGLNTADVMLWFDPVLPHDV